MGFPAVIETGAAQQVDVDHVETRSMLRAVGTADDHGAFDQPGVDLAEHRVQVDPRRHPVRPVGRQSTDPATTDSGVGDDGGSLLDAQAQDRRRFLQQAAGVGGCPRPGRLAQHDVGTGPRGELLPLAAEEALADLAATKESRLADIGGLEGSDRPEFQGLWLQDEQSGRIDRRRTGRDQVVDLQGFQWPGVGFQQVGLRAGVAHPCVSDRFGFLGVSGHIDQQPGGHRVRRCAEKQAHDKAGE